MEDDKEIYLPDTTIKYKVLKQMLEKVYNLEIMPKNTNTRFGKGIMLSKTPAPKKEQIYGSKTNAKNSSASSFNAKSIKFSENTLFKINKKVLIHNENYSNKKISLSIAKAVVRRGMGAYSSSHRPIIGGGSPNSRVAWGLARLNAFIYKAINGKSKSGKYIQDDDLFNELSINVKKYDLGGNMDKFEYSIGGI